MGRSSARVKQALLVICFFVSAFVDTAPVSVATVIRVVVTVIGIPATVIGVVVTATGCAVYIFFLLYTIIKDDMFACMSLFY